MKQHLLFLWSSVKASFAKSWRLWWKPLDFYFVLYRGVSWPFRIFIAIATVWLIGSVGYLISLFDK